MPTTGLTDIRAVAVTVNDQDRALAFYLDTLGFEKRLDAPISDTMRWIEVAPPGATTTIALVRAEGGTSPGTDTGVRFTVADAAAEHVAMRDRGITTSDLLVWDEVPPMFSFDDPDGNRFYAVEHVEY
jgi:catechol 2,3-dioxygenase-like lactoylglutathione lyase family enzyme